MLSPLWIYIGVHAFACACVRVGVSVGVVVGTRVCSCEDVCVCVSCVCAYVLMCQVCLLPSGRCGEGCNLVPWCEEVMLFAYSKCVLSVI